MSPAITPSVTYRHQLLDSTPHQDFTSSTNDVFSADELELTPLSSPAIIPQETNTELNPEHVENFDAVQRHLENLEQAKSILKKQLAELQQQQGQRIVNQRKLIDIISQEKGIQQQQQQQQQHARNNRPSRTSNRSRKAYSPYKDAIQPRKTSSKNSLDSADASSISMPPPSSTTRASWSMLDDSPRSPQITSSKSTPDLKPATPSSIMNIQQQTKSNQQRRSSTSAHKTTPKLMPALMSRTAPTKASPRALRPLLVSPTLDVYSSIEDAAKALESKSNYQNLREGKTDVLGIKFSPGINAGLENRRSAHKKAEKRRRDSLKDWFNKLREEIVHDVDAILDDADDFDDDGATEVSSSNDNSQDKSISKLAVLSRTCDYMKRLKTELKKRDEQIASLEEKLKLSNNRITLG